MPEPNGSTVPVTGIIAEIDPFLRRLTAPNPSVMTGPGTNTYLIGDEVLAVVDPGPDDDGHLTRIEAATAGRRIRYVLVTHTHPDHAPGAAVLAARCGAELRGYDARDGFVPDAELRDGDVLSLGPVRLRTVHTPGHASNHLCYLVEGNGVEANHARRILLSGDHVMGGSTVVISPLDGDMSQYMSSLERLAGFEPSIDAIAPGHGPVLEDPRAEIEKLLEHRRAREQAVLSGLRQRGRATVDELLAAVYLDVDPVRHPMARRSLWAHLRKLGDEAVVYSEDPDDIESLWEARAD